MDAGQWGVVTQSGAIFPALKSIGLSDAAAQRVWASFRQGAWQMPVILGLWRAYVLGLSGWQPHRGKYNRLLASGALRLSE